MTLAAASVMSDLSKSKNTWKERCASGALATGAGGATGASGAGADGTAAGGSAELNGPNFMPTRIPHSAGAPSCVSWVMPPELDQTPLYLRSRTFVPKNSIEYFSV